MVYNDCSGLFKQNDEVEDQVKSNKIITRPEILLHPNLPKPLHSLSPRTIMGKEWTNVRREAYAKNDYHCQCCGMFAPYDFDNKRFVSRDQQLEAHECYDIDYVNCTSRLLEIVAICTRCHSYIHSGRVQSLYDKGILDEQECFEIFTHGDSILIDAGLNPFEKEVDNKTYKEEWSKWNLVYEGKVVYSNFKSYEEWEVKYR